MKIEQEKTIQQLLDEMRENSKSIRAKIVHIDVDNISVKNIPLARHPAGIFMCSGVGGPGLLGRSYVGIHYFLCFFRIYVHEFFRPFFIFAIFSRPSLHHYFGHFAYSII